MQELTATPVTLLLLLINVFVSLAALFGDARMLDQLSFKPREILQNKQYYRLFSAGFVHAGIGHLAFNMITLFYFGPVLEMTLGPIKFVILYLGAELAAHGLTLYFHKDNPNYAAVGASGAISGVVFAFRLYQPFAKIYFFFIPIGIPAILFGVIYVLISVYSMKDNQNNGIQGGIAHEAHLGGAIGGVILTAVLDPTAIQIFWMQVSHVLGF